MTDKPLAFGCFSVSFKIRETAALVFEKLPPFGHEKITPGPYRSKVFHGNPPGGDADFHIALDQLLGNVLAFPLLQLGVGECFH